MHPVILGRMFGLLPPWMYPMNPAMATPMMPMGVLASLHTGPFPWIYARQGCEGAPWQQRTPTPRTYTPWHMLEPNDRFWSHDRRSFDPADVGLEHSPEDSDEERSKEKQPEQHPDLGPGRMPPVEPYMQPPPGWVDYMQRMRRFGPADPWQAYNPGDLDAPMHQRYSRIYNRNWRSDWPMEGRGEFSESPSAPT
jgi:hypothetical protein